MAGRKAGTPKTGGRTKGTPNKTTTVLKGLIGDLLENKFTKFAKELDKLEGRDFVQYYIKMTQFCVPLQRQKMQKVDFSSLSDEEQESIINDITERLKNA